MIRILPQTLNIEFLAIRGSKKIKLIWQGINNVNLLMLFIKIQKAVSIDTASFILVFMPILQVINNDFLSDLFLGCFNM